MKRQFVRQCLGVAVGLGLFSGCAKPAAQTDQPRTVAAPAPAAFAAGQPPQQFAADQAPPPSAPPSTAPQGASEPLIEQRIPPAQPANMSPGVDELARLAQGGVNEDVMLAYIQKYPGRFNVSADQIVYLNDLGISSNVVTAMLKHDGDTTTLSAPTAPAPTVPNQQISNVPQGQPAGEPGYPPQPIAAAPQQPVQSQVATPPATPPPPSTDMTYFYDSLSPYGSWMYVSGYGWCWQPTVAVVGGVGWRPYCDRGRWYWSDSGWYWHSDYSWGWAPFHYGRWYMHPRAGWIWAPGVVWGPAWVSWRYSEGYCGWAPLPPEAYWAPGVGLTYYGRHVSVTFDFGLGWNHYAFVSVNRFCDPHPFRYVVPRTQVVNVYRNTTVVNNYTVVNNTIINRGVGRETIARHSQNEIRQVKVQPTSFAAGSDRMGRLERHGNDVVAFRPQLPKEPPVKPAVIQNRMAQQVRVARLDNNPDAAPRVNRGTVAEQTPRAGAGAVAEPRTRNEGGAVTPRVERANPPVQRPQPVNPAPTRVEPRQNVPNRVEPRQNVPERTPPVRQAPTPQARRDTVTAPTPVPSVQAPATTPRSVYPETRSTPSVPSVTPPVTPRATPSMSPRYAEQYGNHGGVPAGRPDYGAARALPRQEPSPGYSVPHNTGNAGTHAGPASRGEVGAGRGGEGGRGRER